MTTPSPIAFETLWTNYPTSDPCIDPKTGNPPKGFSNQCAIRLGRTLELSGVSFRSFHGGVCPVPKHTPGMAASAQQLADWLKRHPFPGCGKAENFTGSGVFQEINDRTGIIFLKDYWQRDGEKAKGARSGDHIDLWNGSRLSSWFSWVRVNMHFSIDGIWSDYRLAKKAILWHVP